MEKRGHLDFTFIESLDGDVVHVALIEQDEPIVNLPWGGPPRKTLCRRVLKKFRASIHFIKRDQPKYFCTNCYILLRKAANSVDLTPKGRLL